MGSDYPPGQISPMVLIVMIAVVVILSGPLANLATRLL